MIPFQPAGLQSVDVYCAYMEFILQPTDELAQGRLRHMQFRNHLRQGRRMSNFIEVRQPQRVLIHTLYKIYCLLQQVYIFFTYCQRYNQLTGIRHGILSVANGSKVGACANKEITSVKTGVIFLLTTEIPQTGFRKFSGGGLFLRPAALFIGYGASMFGGHPCRLCRFQLRQLPFHLNDQLR